MKLRQTIALAATLIAATFFACMTSIAENPPKPPDLIVPPTEWVWIGTDFHNFNMRGKPPSTLTDPETTLANVYIDRSSYFCYRQDRKFPLATKLTLEMSSKVGFASVFGYLSPSKKPQVDPNVDVQNLYYGQEVAPAALQVKTQQGNWTYYTAASAPGQTTGATAWNKVPVQADCLACHNDKTHGTTDQVFTRFFPALTTPSVFLPISSSQLKCEY